MSEVTRYQGEIEAVTPEDVQHPGLLDRATDSWVASVAETAKLARYIADTEFVPDSFRGSPPATAAAMLYGREIGVPPMTALQMLHVVKGRVGMAAELMRARVLAAGHEIVVAESTSAKCTIRGRRRGTDSWTEVSWSMGDARQAGLGGDNWRKYPRQMLQARASAELCRLVFPDVTHGMAALEELDEAAVPTNGADIEAAPRKLVSRKAAQKREAAQPAAVSPPPLGPPPAAPAPPEEPPLPGESEPGEAPPRPIQDVPLPQDDGPRTTPRGEARAAQEPASGPAPARPAGLLATDMASDAQHRLAFKLLRDLDVAGDRDQRIHIAQGLLNRRIKSFNQITAAEMTKLIDTLTMVAQSNDPADYLDWLVEEGHNHLRLVDENPDTPDADLLAFEPEEEEQ